MKLISISRSTNQLSLPDFMNNHTELVNIHSMFDKIQNDKNLTIKGIGIEGFASPEGPLAFNEQLSQETCGSLERLSGQRMRKFLPNFIK